VTAYEKYREKLMTDPDAIANVQRAETAGCILRKSIVAPARRELIAEWQRLGCR
jgi:hypothetical protein